MFFEPWGEPVENGNIPIAELENSPDIVVTDLGIPDEDIFHSDGEKDDALDDFPFAESTSKTRIEVAIPEFPLEKRSQYVSVRSEIVEFVKSELPMKRGKTTYNIEFTDGREELVSGF